MEETIIYKYLSGIATSEEEEMLLEWLRESPANQNAFQELKAVWHARQQFIFAEESKVNHSLELLNNRIQERKNPKVKKRNLSKRWGSVAAVLFLLLGMTYIFQINVKRQNMEVTLCEFKNEAFTDSVITVTLPDGTNVWLAANTTLKYPNVFTGNTRKVHLEGMAFFEVTKIPQQPFIVLTDIVEIKVLGTSFSVNSHFSEGKGETILMSGSVQLKLVGSVREFTLLPGQQALYSKGSSLLDINEVDVNTLTAWRFGIISLTEATASDIVRKLEDIYHFKIQMDISSIKDNTYNFSFKRSGNPDKVLEQFSRITGKKAIVVDR